MISWGDSSENPNTISQSPQYNRMTKKTLCGFQHLDSGIPFPEIYIFPFFVAILVKMFLSGNLLSSLLFNGLWGLPRTLIRKVSDMSDPVQDSFIWTQSRSMLWVVSVQPREQYWLWVSDTCNKQCPRNFPILSSWNICLPYKFYPFCASLMHCRLQHTKSHMVTNVDWSHKVQGHQFFCHDMFLSDVNLLFVLELFAIKNYLQ